MSKRHALAYAPVVAKDSPWEAERDRLLDLRMRGMITRGEYLADVAAVERAQAAAERVR